MQEIEDDDDDEEEDDDDDDEEFDEEAEEEMSAMIEAVLSENVEVPTDGNSKFDKVPIENVTESLQLQAVKTKFTVSTEAFPRFLYSLST